MMKTMRTTVELTTAQRAELLRIAGRRGMKGFSIIVQEAIDAFLANQVSRQSLIDGALAVKGTLRPKEAVALEARVRSIRTSWR